MLLVGMAVHLHHQRDGNEAGLSAYRELSQNISRAGFNERSVGQETLRRIAELESRLAQGLE